MNSWRKRDARAPIMAAYKREIYPWAEAYDRAVKIAEQFRNREKAAIDAALAHSDFEEKIRQLGRI